MDVGSYFSIKNIRNHCRSYCEWVFGIVPIPICQTNFCEEEIKLITINLNLHRLFWFSISVDQKPASCYQSSIRHKSLILIITPNHRHFQRRYQVNFDREKFVLLNDSNLYESSILDAEAATPFIKT